MRLNLALCAFLVGFLLMMTYQVGKAQGINWSATNQATISWEGITYPVDTGERVRYAVQWANIKVDPDKATPTEVEVTASTQSTITFLQKGSYIVGVSSVLEVDDGAGTWERVQASEVAWSDDPQYVLDGAVFGFRYYPVPDAPGGLRPVSQ